MPSSTMTRSAAARVRGAGRLALGLPCGRRSPRGRLRWYLVAVPEGREESTCERVRRLVPRAVLEDAFCISKERWFKRQGVWFTDAVLMYRGFFFAASRDAAALDKALAGLSFPAKLVGSEGRAWAPVSDEAVAWLADAMDEGHVIRSSTAVIEDGELHVVAGPLVGQEARIERPDRHKRVCLVRVADADGGFVERMPLDIPVKR